jgi:chloride channel protein, CIC family
VPMMAATAAAVLAAHLLGSPPIYDSLRARMPVEATSTDGDGQPDR